jgi:hypothetical protein
LYLEYSKSGDLGDLFVSQLEIDETKFNGKSYCEDLGYRIERGYSVPISARG